MNLTIRAAARGDIPAVVRLLAEMDKDAHRFYESLGFQQHGISFAITPVVPLDGSHNLVHLNRGGLVTE
jgi:hypothetical protein